MNWQLGREHPQTQQTLKNYLFLLAKMHVGALLLLAQKEKLPAPAFFVILLLMSEVAFAGEDHGYDVAVGHANGFFVALGVAGLDDGGDASFGGSLQETLKANPYVYADNDPVNNYDPDGRDCLPDALGSFFSAVGVIRGFQTTLSFTSKALGGPLGDDLASMVASGSEVGLSQGVTADMLDAAAVGATEASPVGIAIDGAILGGSLVLGIYSIIQTTQEC
ncbi:hypothetical protein [Dictyobacter arantiisoli]|uniref:Uncharacterized protein n=1 Tax=Dictyobacter arantiisoli TaxID=2014874 RepID=A0A5A5TBV9_9CHLR|nr:hypothetical protein [Dictyobacter arantiisoli]GCF08858.1 hypothetical protein KDI_24220 [Dictyobacter arantiisoli]